MSRRAIFALLLLLNTLGAPYGRRAFAQEETAEDESGDSSADGYRLPDDLDALDGETEAYQLPDDVDEAYQLPDDLDEDYALPDDLDEDDTSTDDLEGNDEWDFGDLDGDAPPDLPLFGETTFSLTSTLITQYRLDNFNANAFDDNFLSFWEKLEFAMQGEHLRLTMRLDAFVPLFTSDCPPESATLCFYDYDIRLERFTLHYEEDGFTADAVDSYAVLGRGIALALRRVDQLGVDTTLRGGQAGYDEGRFFVRGMGGSVNPQNVDPQTLRIITEPKDQLRDDLFSHPERRDFMLAGEAGYRLPGVSLGAHAVHLWFAEQNSTRHQVSIFGWRVDAPALLDGKLSLYGEVNTLLRVSDGELGTTRDHGHALYGAAQARLGNLTLLLEWKDYHNYRLAPTNGEGSASRVYSGAPTFERADERPEALHNARGGRFQADYGFLPGTWSLSATALAYGFAEHVEVDPWDDILVTHIYAKVQRVPDASERIGWSFAAEAGFRRETYIEEDAIFADLVENDEYATIYHVLVEGGLVIGDHSIEALLSHRDERHFEGFSYVEYIRGQFALTYSYLGRFRISPVLTWNTQSVGSGAPSIYGGLEARVDFLSGSFLRVFGGQTPGGLLCSGGVCRDVPPFQGFTAEFVLRL